MYRRGNTNRPIIFIGHSLGENVILHVSVTNPTIAYLQCDRLNEERDDISSEDGFLSYANYRQ